MHFFPEITVVGGGLAGSEAAWQAAQRGVKVRLYEMRPLVSTGAHQTSDLAELVCSNSLGSNLPDHPSGILKNELHRLGSLLLKCAESTAIPAGSALAVDRNIFAHSVTEHISSHPNIELIRAEITEIPNGITIIASGPLTSEALSRSIAALTGKRNLYFYDALAPIVYASSINMNVAFRASRYGKGQKDYGDYINCPLNKEKYYSFVEALISSERFPLREFETEIDHGVNTGGYRYFEGCLPVEIIARRETRALAFGPMRPVGLIDPHTGQHPYAVVQLRQDNLAGDLYNMVGFQTNQTQAEQRRVFRMIPGLENAEFVRYGQMHRNTFITSPLLLLPTLQYRDIRNLFFTGQITGVEGYLGNIGTGLLAGLNGARLYKGEFPLTLPKTTVLGSLCYYISHADLKDFQPMKANFGLLPLLQTKQRLGRRERANLISERAKIDLENFLNEVKL